MSEYDDFKEVAHCGGQVTFDISCDPNGRRAYSIGFRHSRPTPAAWVGIYALAPHGIPVDDFRIGGIGQGFEPQPPQGTFPVFLGSDSRQCWGHECPRCRGYFRNKAHSAIYPLTCPYCGLRTKAFQFLTTAQRKFIQHYIDTLQNGLETEMEPGTSREFVIDMDAIADIEAGQAKPDFYYASESQQTRWNCSQCGEFNDIRGRYGYCASCGWRNNNQSLQASFADLRKALNDQQHSPAQTVKLSISEFDACCRDMATQIRERIPMKATRKAELERLIFHDIESATIEFLRKAFDVDLLRGMNDELIFIKMMMHRRHIFEHNAAVADERYVRESGDTDAREGALVRETQANAHRLISNLTRIIGNFEKDLHDIFIPTEWPISNFRQRTAQRAGGV